MTGLVGAGAASAAPGISYDNGSGPVGIGDQTATGAQASATTGNQALAISIFRPSTAKVDGSATGSNAVAVDGRSAIGGNASGNNVITVAGSTDVRGNATGNFVLNVGSDVRIAGNGEESANVLAACGTSFTGQAAHVTVSDLCTAS